MGAIVYYIALPLIYLVSILPFPLLYLLSDFLYLVIYRLLGYRTEVVRSNLKNSFPEKSEVEIRLIEKRFYRYFCDLILETIKTLSIGPNALKKRINFENNTPFEKYYDQKQSVIIVMGHLGNWELAGARFSQDPIHQLFVIYHPLANKHFDRLIYHMRTRLGNKLYAMKETFKGMVRDRKEITATAFIADQTPSPEGAYWTSFLHQDTPVFTGTAKIAKKLNYPVIYISISRPRRGYYIVDSELLIEDPSAMEEDQITETHTRRLERDIQEYPEIWLWTHRRWKHKRPKE